jgi:hypothetical protein
MESILAFEVKSFDLFSIRKVGAEGLDALEAITIIAIVKLTPCSILILFLYAITDVVLEYEIRRKAHVHV